MPTHWKTLLTATLGVVSLSACSFDEAGFFGDGEDDTGADDESDGNTDPTGDGDGDWGTTTGDGDGDSGCAIDCGEGQCVDIDGEVFCECPEGTEWSPYGCAPCPPVDPTGAALAVPIVRFDGEFRVNGVAPPKSEYDDANLWLENTSTHDRVALGNSHDGSFAVRVTPGLYEVVYEVETPGAVMPHNPRIVLTKLALFEPTTRDIEIPVASLGGAFTLDGVAPPVSEYDDANVYFRDHVGQVEVLAGNTHDGSWTVNLVPASYDVVYRVETPGPITPRNDGAVLQTLEVTSSVEVLPLAILSAPVTGSFLIAGAPAPQSEYDDANLWLESDLGGRVALGNSHDQTFAMRVIPGAYAAVYAHETGVNVPRNQQAVFAAVAVGQDGADLALDVPMVALSGALTINGVAAPASEYDDGVVSLHGIDSDDVLVLGNTHDQSYAVNLIPGTYELVYAHETAGGTVPQNTRASLGQLVVGAPVGGHDVDVSAVPVAGNFTVGGGVGFVQILGKDFGEDARIGQPDGQDAGQRRQARDLHQ